MKRLSSFLIALLVGTNAFAKQEQAQVGRTSVSEVSVQTMILSDAVNKEITSVEEASKLFIGRQIRITTVGERKKFALCEYSSLEMVTNCRDIGSSNGYTTAQLQTRYNELERRARLSSRIQLGGAIVGFLGAAAYGVLKVKPLSYSNPPQQFRFGLCANCPTGWFPMTDRAIAGQASLFGLTTEQYLARQTMWARVNQAVVYGVPGAAIGLGTGYLIASSQGLLGTAEQAQNIGHALSSGVLIVPVEDLDAVENSLSLALVGI